MSKEKSQQGPKLENKSFFRKDGPAHRWLKDNAISIPAFAIGFAAWPGWAAVGAFAVGGYYEIKSWRDIGLLGGRKAERSTAPAHAPRRTLATVV